MNEIVSLLSAAGGSSLILALLVFGLMPSMVTRAISITFPEDDPRRVELMVELRALSRWEQPFWALQQVERVFSEAIPARRARRARGPNG